MTPYETAKDILQLQEQQTSIKNANQYIDNFIIYYKELGKAYNSTGYNQASFFEFEKEEYLALMEAFSETGFLTLCGPKLVEIIVPYARSGFLIRIDLSEKTVSELLEGIFTEYEPYYVLDFFECDYCLTNMDASLTELLPSSVPSLNHASPAADISTSGNTFTKPDTITLDGYRYYCFEETIPYGNGRIRFLFPKESLSAGTKIYQSLHLYFFLLMCMTCCFFTWGSYSLIHKPIRALTKAFQGINRQDYSVRLMEKKNSDFTNLYKEFNHMAQELGTLIEKDYKQQLLLNKAELKQLQAQINPHFLYNAFFLLRRMIQDEMFTEARKMADTLGLYFQYITRNSQDQMPLHQEYRHAMLYCEIQQLRFEGRIQVQTVPLPEAYAPLPVPKLIIQPILENAFNYGLHDKVDDGILRVSMEETSEHLVIVIEDNGEDLTDIQLEEIRSNLSNVSKSSALHEMTGILNIQRRLIIYTDNKGYLKASRSSLGGLCIRLYLPVTAPEGTEENFHSPKDNE